MQFLALPPYRRRGNEKGFTLIEIITVILLLGIIGVMGSEVITTTFKGFADSDEAMELFEEGKLALMRMEREIHHMVPNAIDDPSGGSTIRFGLIDVNTLNDNDLAGQYQPIGATTRIRDLSTNTINGELISIYNTSWTDFTSTASRKIYNTTFLPGNIMDLGVPVIGGHSATKRYYPVQKAVRYHLSGTVLFRAETRVTLAADDFISTLDGITGFPLLSNVTSLSFNYTPASLTSNALVRINFTLSRDDTTLDFHKEIQVRNVP